MKLRFDSQSPPGTQAITRAITVLRTLADAPNGLGITELAVSMGLNKAIVFRLLGALEVEGMVVRAPASNSYRLGPDLIRLGTSALRATDLNMAAHDELVALVEETGEMATLEVLVGSDVLIIGEVQGRFLLGSVPELGMRWPAYATSTGKVLLAFAHPPAPEGDFTKRTPKTIISRRVFERQLEQVRLQGYATAVDELEAGFSAVAAPVRNHLGNVVGAISINGPTARLTTQRLSALVAPVRHAADRVSRRLGATPAMLRVESATPSKMKKPPKPSAATMAR